MRVRRNGCQLSNYEVKGGDGSVVTMESRIISDKFPSHYKKNIIWQQAMDVVKDLRQRAPGCYISWCCEQFVTFNNIYQTLWYISRNVVKVYFWQRSEKVVENIHVQRLKNVVDAFSTNLLIWTFVILGRVPRTCLDVVILGRVPQRAYDIGNEYVTPLFLSGVHFVMYFNELNIFFFF